MLEDELFYTVLFISFLIFYVSSRTIQFTKKKEYKYRQKNNVSLVFVYMSICFNLYRIITVIITEGFLNFLIRDRAIEILNESSYWGGKGVVDFLFLLILPAMMIAIYKQIQDRKVIGYIGFVFMLVNLLFFSLHRTPIVISFSLAILWYHFNIRRIKIMYMVLGVGVVVIFMAYSAFMRTGDYMTRLTTIEIINTGLSGLNTGTEFHKLWESVQKGDLDLEYGKNLYYYNVISFIPRRLWPEKPAVSFNARMTEKYYQYRIAESTKQWVHTFTVLGEGFMQGHVAGVFLYSFLFVLLYKYLFYFLSRFEGGEIISFQQFLSIPIILRGALDSILISIVVTIIAFQILKFFMFTKKKYLMPNIANYYISQ